MATEAVTPSIAPAIVAPEDEPGKPVQGHSVGFGDIILRTGHPFTVELGGSVQSVTLNRTIEGSSSVTVQVYDPERKVLNASLLASHFDIQLDGLWFRYIGAQKQGKTIILTFEDRDVAILRELKGPKKAFRANMTRAEFILSLVREARPKIAFYAPELHVRQRVQNSRQAKTTKGQKAALRQPGLGRQDLGHITVKHAKASLQQIGYINTVLDTGMSMGAALKVLIASIMTITQESDVSNLTGSGGVDVGLFSQNAHDDWPATRDPAKDAGASNGFFPKAIRANKANPKLSLNDLCQAVQASGVPNAYGQWEKEATATVNEYLGGAGAGGTITQTVQHPYVFEVKKGEDYWAAIQRLAGEVKWRAFMCNGRLFYISETDLLKGQVRLAIDGDTTGVDNVDFDYHKNKPVTECTVTAWIADWAAPPGSVATLADYGPASIGSGDAPSAKPGISDNQVAATGVGRGRYIVSTISSDLRRAAPSPADLATITLKKPTKPLPEPPSPTTTNTLSISAAAGGSVGGMGVLKGTPEDIVNEVIDYAHTHGFPNITRKSVRAANAAHGPTVDGNLSDHQGPPSERWAADMSNGVTTKEETHLAAAIARAFGIPWSGSGLVTHRAGGYRLQLIYKTMQGGDHYNHVHFGCAKG